MKEKVEYLEIDFTPNGADNKRISFGTLAEIQEKVVKEFNLEGGGIWSADQKNNSIHLREKKYPNFPQTEKEIKDQISELIKNYSIQVKIVLKDILN